MARMASRPIPTSTSATSRAGSARSAGCRFPPKDRTPTPPPTSTTMATSICSCRKSSPPFIGAPQNGPPLQNRRYGRGGGPEPRRLSGHYRRQLVRCESGARESAVVWGGAGCGHIHLLGRAAGLLGVEASDLAHDRQ